MGYNPWKPFEANEFEVNKETNSNKNISMKMERIQASDLVQKLIEETTALWKMQLPPEICIGHLESGLRVIWVHSKVLSKFLRTEAGSSGPRSTVSLSDISDVLSFSASDVALLLPLAAAKRPN